MVFLIKLKEGAVEAFLKAYEDIRHVVAAGVPGHIVDQVCQSPDDPHEWLITSEWETIDRFTEWERTPEHRVIAQPLRECVAQARSLRFVVRQQTGQPLPA